VDLGSKGGILNPIKEALRAAYYRSKLVRHMSSWLIGDNRLPADFVQALVSRKQLVGPVHDDEALFLFSLTRMLYPQTIVEFGFRTGHSAFNFIQAAVPGCKIFSYDIWWVSEEIAHRCFGHFKQFRFIRKSQEEFAPGDIDNRKIDLCFMDASHNTALNLQTLELIRPHLAEQAIVAVHDTGVWHKEFFKEQHLSYAYSDFGRSIGEWLDEDRYQPAVSERLFVDTVLHNYPEFSQLHVHSAYTLRNGMTLLQRKIPLPLASGPED